MLTIDQIKQVGIPKNVSRLNNRELLGVAIPNESVNLYEAIITVLDDQPTTGATDLSATYTSTSIELVSSSGTDVSLSAASIVDAGVMAAADKININSLVTLSGVSADALHLGTFTGLTIPDNSTIKQALQALETTLELSSAPTTVYTGDGTIVGNRSLTLQANNSFFIKYLNGSPALSVSDFVGSSQIQDSNATFSLIATNGYAQISKSSSVYVRVDQGDTVNVRCTGAVISASNSSPAATALLDLQSTTKVFLPPRMTTAERDLISSPATGGMIYNTTTNKLNIFTGSTWEVITSS